MHHWGAAQRADLKLFPTTDQRLERLLALLGDDARTGEPAALRTFSGTFVTSLRSYKRMFSKPQKTKDVPDPRDFRWVGAPHVGCSVSQWELRAHGPCIGCLTCCSSAQSLTQTHDSMSGVHALHPFKLVRRAVVPTGYQSCGMLLVHG